MRGTVLNVVAILVGTGAGVLIGNRLSERVRATVMDGLGLFTLVLGIYSATDAFGAELEAAVGPAGVLLILGALVAGAIVGELADLEGHLNRLGAWLQRLAQRPAKIPVGSAGEVAILHEPPVPVDGRGRFTEGFVVASLLFAVGPLAILGPLQDVLTGSVDVLAVKSLLDGFAALALASALGIGVAFSAGVVFLLQGAVAAAGMAFGDIFSAPMVTALNAVGGLLVIAIALRLLEIREIRVANFLPALILGPVAVAVFS